MCGPEESRTPDLSLAKRLLYQLSYRPKFISRVYPKIEFLQSYSLTPFLTGVTYSK